MNILLLANQLAPQVSEIRIAAAHLMMSRGAYEEASAVLRPLASDAHRGATAAVAIALLELAKNHRPPGPLVLNPENGPKER